MTRISVSRVTKDFPGARALDDVSLEISVGEVHALVGENGAGKSTLSRVIVGDLPPDAGAVLLDGNLVSFRDPADAIDRGVVLVPQELLLVPRLSVYDNVWLGRRPPNRRQSERVLRETLSLLGAGFDLEAPIFRLDRASRRLVQLARGLCLATKVLLLDEPTEGLTAETYRRLKKILAEKCERGITTVYVSHRLSEVIDLADRITVMRDGRVIETVEANRTEERTLIRAMAGVLAAEDPSDVVRRPTGEVLLSVRALTGEAFADVSLEVRAGEVVGLAGVPGSGRSEFLRAVSGVSAYSSGEIVSFGGTPRRASPRSALARGIAYLPSDRMNEGIVSFGSVRLNMLLSEWQRTVRRGVRIRTAEAAIVREHIASLRIAASGIDEQIRTLSGGNQQKTLLARLTLSGARVWLMEEPTQGVDVAGKAEIHRLIREAAALGRGVLIASSEMKELIDLCDRIVVMRAGRIVADVEGDKADPEEILSLSLPLRAASG